MFQGTLPNAVLKIVGEMVKEWNVDRIYVGCSGNFIIERSISRFVGCPITSNDVTIYSGYIGRYLAGEQLKDLSIREEFKGKYKVFDKYMKTDTDKIAMLIIASDMLTYDRPGLYYQRMWDAYVEQLPKLHKQLAHKLEVAKTNIDSFYLGDVMELLDNIDPDDGFISFPPFYSGGYEHMWSKLEDVFFFEKPEYKEFDPDTVIMEFCEKVKKIKNYIICMERPIEMLEEDLIGESVTLKGKTIYVYGKSSKKHLIESRSKKTKAKPIIKLSENEK